MGDAGYRGVSADQDSRFGNKDRKLIKQLESSKLFPASFSKKVDLRKVNLDVMKPWIEAKTQELLGFEDDVVVEYVMGMLESEENQPTPNPRQLQLSLTGFLESSTPKFMAELWELLLSAQDSIGGIPQQFVDKKKEEMRAARERDAAAIRASGVASNSQMRLGSRLDAAAGTTTAAAAATPSQIPTLPPRPSVAPPRGGGANFKDKRGNTTQRVQDSGWGGSRHGQPDGNSTRDRDRYVPSSSYPIKRRDDARERRYDRGHTAYSRDEYRYSRSNRVDDYGHDRGYDYDRYEYRRPVSRDSPVRRSTKGQSKSRDYSRSPSRSLSPSRSPSPPRRRRRHDLEEDRYASRYRHDEREHSSRRQRRDSRSITPPSRSRQRSRSRSRRSYSTSSSRPSSRSPSPSSSPPPRRRPSYRGREERETHQESRHSGRGDVRSRRRRKEGRSESRSISPHSASTPRGFASSRRSYTPESPRSRRKSRSKSRSRSRSRYETRSLSHTRSPSSSSHPSPPPPPPPSYSRRPHSSNTPSGKEASRSKSYDDDDDNDDDSHSGSSSAPSHHSPPLPSGSTSK